MELQSHSFEFGDSFDIFSRKKLESYLNAIWAKHKQADDQPPHNDKLTLNQCFLTFDGKTARAQNYIGFIQGENDHIEIYPKVFKGHNLEKKEILKHLFFWFDYCRKWKFPFSNVQLDRLDDIDLPELIINLIANQIFEVISISPISLYEEVEEAMLMPKGTINFNRYINNSLSTGNFHVLECDHEPLLFDNRLNRAIKYVTRILLSRAKFSETRKKLDEIIFLLDDVEDCSCTSASLKGIKLNSFFLEYQTVIGLCKMVLDQQLYSNHFDEQSHWSLLLPMEYVFEDFVAGFLATHFSNEWKVEYQKSDLYLTDEDVFKMQHDIFLTSKSKPEIKVIVDTKYKMRGDKFKEDKKRGIAQSDLYQMTSYAYRRGCNNVLLIYPNQDKEIKEEDIFSVSNHNNSQKIKVVASEIPFWSMDGYKAILPALEKKLTSLLQINFNGS